MLYLIVKAKSHLTVPIGDSVGFVAPQRFLIPTIASGHSKTKAITGDNCIYSTISGKKGFEAKCP